MAWRKKTLKYLLIGGRGGAFVPQWPDGGDIAYAQTEVNFKPHLQPNLELNHDLNQFLALTLILS